MESPDMKKQKLCKHTQSLCRSLNKICEWEESDNVAIKYCDVGEIYTNVTYAQLRSTCIAICHHLQNVKGSLFVGISSDIPMYCIPGLMLGIMSSGRAFVCLQTSTPEARRICHKLNISHIFSHQEVPGTQIVLDCVVLDQNILLTKNDEESEECFEFENADGKFAYATTTSGSTGEPKIVKVTHDAIVPNILDLKKILEISEKDTVAQITPLTFDPSIIEIFLPFSSGGSLFMASGDLKDDPETLLQMLLKYEVSVLQSTPSLLLQRWSNDELKKSLLGKDTNLRILLIGGEHFPSEKILPNIRSHDNRTRIFDIYGITEVSCWACIREVGINIDSPSLGSILSNTILEIRNDMGMRVEEGEGILYIGSDSRVCVIDDEDIEHLHKPVFRDSGDIAVINRNGDIKLKGRHGRRVKRYGKKIYLSNLESHVQQLSFVKNCYALFEEKNQSLHLYFTTFAKSANEAEQEKWQNEISSHTHALDDIYRPDEITMLNHFVLTTNGKICKNSLKKNLRKLDKVSKNNISKLNVAKTFENIWKRFLPVEEELGFLNAGGSSVIGLRIANLFEEKIGAKSPKLLSLLLRNENLKVCREYVVTSQLSDSSSHGQIFTSIETSIDDKDGDRTGQFFNEKNSKIVETSQSEIKHERFVTANEEKHFKGFEQQKENSDKRIPWQKCRGRNNFQNFDGSHNRGWIASTKIRLMNHYDLMKCVDASPTVFKYPGGQSYVTVGSHAGIICTAALSKDNSNIHWRVSLPNRIEASVLVIDNFKGIVGSYDGFLYCVDLKSGEIFWKFKTDDIVKCTAVLCPKNQTVFFGSYDRKAYCVSLGNGSQVWGAKVGNGSFCATPWVNDELNSVLFASLDGTCVSLKQRNGEINWLEKLDYPVFSAPVILKTGTAIFCDVSGNLHFMSAASGQRLRNIKINGNIFSALTVYEDPETKLQSILFGSENRKIYKMQLQPEQVEPIFDFTKDVGVPIASTPSTNGEIIVVAGNDGDLKILDFGSGDVLYNYKLGGNVFSSPIIYEDFIVVGCRDNFLYVILKYNEE
ncbi:beta-alanine-activating enzyme [Venturia canescens]|uniref:beta-alanine-activating enzyme n=1 Tax=Venturia canescens TaxID=32260 RepID=UPI001C9D577B|nr:beta-alanine-activating enzyme [Venturia canescens]